METVTASRGSSTDRSGPTDLVLSADDGGVATALGGRLGTRWPMTAGMAMWAIAFVVLSLVLIGLGLVLIHTLLPAGLARVDTAVSRWFVRERTTTLDPMTLIGSDLASTGAIVGVAAIAVVVLAIGRHWRQVGFLIAALTLEFGVFLTTTFLIDRSRPPVARLDPAPVTSSFPSGHVAAALTLYVGLAIVVVSLVRSALVRGLAWALAIGIPIVVAVSRVYRGMHHLTDVTASLVLGSGAIVFALLATRSTVAAADRDEEQAPAPRSGAEVAS